MKKLLFLFLIIILTSCSTYNFFHTDTKLVKIKNYNEKMYILKNEFEEHYSMYKYGQIYEPKVYYLINQLTGDTIKYRIRYKYIRDLNFYYYGR